MKEQKQTLPQGPTRWFLSWFGLGFLPKAPGTFGTLGAMPLLYLLSLSQFSLFIHWSIYLATLGLTIYVTEQTQKKFSLHDPQWIVIDEVLGVWIAWLILGDNSLLSFVLLFGVFRFFDIVKIWPANFFDRLHHGSGTILDDVVSGIYCGFLLKIVQHFI